jgi:hypothetical protein
MSTYLSVDLDFFNTKPPADLVKFFYKVRNHYSRPVLVESHEDLVEHVNQNQPTMLINVDEHSDYLEFEELKEGLNRKCHCGNWVNHVKGVQSYRWLAPNKDVTSFRQIMNNGVEVYLSKGRGRGDNVEEFYTRKGNKQRHIPDAKIWYGLSRINWDTVSAIGVAISSDYTNHTVREYFVTHCLPLFKEKQFDLTFDPCVLEDLMFIGVEDRIRRAHF